MKIAMYCEDRERPYYVEHPYVWVTMVPGYLPLVGWHCGCGATHQSSFPSMHPRERALLYGSLTRRGAKLIRLSEDDEILDYQRGMVTGVPVTPDVVEGWLDELWASADVDPVALLPDHIVAATVQAFRAGVARRRLADDALARIRRTTSGATR